MVFLDVICWTTDHADRQNAFSLVRNGNMQLMKIQVTVITHGCNLHLHKSYSCRYSLVKRYQRNSVGDIHVKDTKS